MRGGPLLPPPPSEPPPITPVVALQCQPPSDAFQQPSVDVSQYHEYVRGVFTQGLRQSTPSASCWTWGTLGFLWLLALRPEEWAQVGFFGSIPSYWSLSIRSRWGERLVPGSTFASLSTAVPSPHVGFVGSDFASLRSDLNDFSSPFPVVVFLGGKPRRKAKLQRRSWSPLSQMWHTVSHAELGGSTDFTTDFLVVGHTHPLSLEPAIPQTIAAILDHGSYLRPVPEDHVTLRDSDRIAVNAPLAPLLLKSRLSLSGWGKRCLSPKELFAAWDVPLWAPRPDRPSVAVNLLLVMPPLRILLGVSDALCSTLSLPRELLRGHTLASLQVPVHDPRGEWLPTVDRWLSFDWIDSSLLTAKAAKADAASLPTQLWDRRISLLWPSWRPNALERLRHVLFGYTCRRVFLSFRSHLLRVHGPAWTAYVQGGRSGGLLQKLSETTSDFERDILVGRMAIRHFTSGSWWKWSGGSTPLFWRWPTPYARTGARDGFEVYVKGSLPKYKRKQRSMDPDVAECLATKIVDLLEKGYVSQLPQQATSDVDYFAVPKVTGPNGEVLDVRVVFNGTSSGLNDAIWAPSFWLPTADTALRKLQHSSMMIDFDLGEMFLNFFLPVSLRRFAGVRMEGIESFLRSAGEEKWSLVQAWERLLFGFSASPYNAVKSYYHAEEFVVGDHKESGSPLRWDRVILNLPGMESFDPRLPWIMLWDDERNCLAGAVVTFVDDGRGSGKNVEHVWAVLHRCATRLQHLGIQVAIRKIRPPAPGIPPGAWTGTIIEVLPEGIFKTVAQNKWEKARAIIQSILQELKEKGDLQYKPLESKRGFLVHMASTFKAINPYLKGVHLTLDSWRANRDDEGWKMKSKAWSTYLEGIEDDDLREEVAALGSAGHPEKVNAVPRLQGDLKVLESFFSSDKPTRVCVRPSWYTQVVLSFGDASGNGFGSTFLSKEGLSYRIGRWHYKGESSCSFEFRNLLDALEEEGKAGRLHNAFVLLITDNAPVEEALYKGSSKSKELLAMVQEFHMLEMKYGFQALVCHCAGTRMIEQGTDGLSRGGLGEGVMSGKPMTSFLPLHLPALARSEGLLDWVKGWAGSKAVLLEPLDWFTLGHDIKGGKYVPDVEPSKNRKRKTEGATFWQPEIEAGTYIWAPPPAAAIVALEELRKARIKRQNSTHIFIVPKLLTPLWRKQLYKAADMMMEITPTCPFWPAAMHEPVFIAVLFPFCRFEPWSLRGTPKVLRTQRTLQNMWKVNPLDTGDILRKLLAQGRRAPFMSRELVRKLLYYER